MKELPWQDIDKNKNGAIERDEWLLYWTKRCAQMQWTGPGGLKVVFCCLILLVLQVTYTTPT